MTTIPHPLRGKVTGGRRSARKNISGASKVKKRNE
jgi:hypothetical protein